MVWSVRQARAPRQAEDARFDGSDSDAIGFAQVIARMSSDVLLFWRMAASRGFDQGLFRSPGLSPTR